MPRKLETLNLNDKVKFGKHQVNEEESQPIIWRIVAQNHSCTPAYPQNAVTLWTDKIIDERVWDSYEPTNPDTWRQQKGNNRFIHSNILQWLNSSATAGSWYSPQHEYDSSPDTAESCFNINVFYAHRAGFLNSFTKKEREGILETSFRVVKCIEDGGGYDDVKAKVFLPSATELGYADESGIPEGALWSTIDGTNSRIGYFTEQYFSNTLLLPKPTNIGKAAAYYLRTPGASKSFMVRSSSLAGTIQSTQPYVPSGIRPVLNLSNDALISDEPDEDGCYTVIIDEPPIIEASPGDLGVLSAPLKKLYSITDKDDNSLTVTEKLNGEVIRTLTDCPSGAKINLDLTSIWQSLELGTPYAAEIQVSDGTLTEVCKWTFTRSNAVPSIDTKEISSRLALPLRHEYTVNDPNADMLTVTEMLDGQTIRKLEAQPSGTKLIFDLNDLWKTLSKDSPHTATVEVSDGLLRDVRSWTFNVIEPIAQHIVSDQSPVRPSSVVIPVLPIEILVSNNANDVEPTWENASSEYVARKPYIFKNDTKTASDWCVEIKYNVNGVTAPTTLKTVHEIKGVNPIENR